MLLIIRSKKNPKLPYSDRKIKAPLKQSIPAMSKQQIWNIAAHESSLTKVTTWRGKVLED